jgi:hypothetical protein
MGRNFLKGAHGDAANAVLAAAGYNFRRLLAWLAALWRVLIAALLVAASDVNLASHADPRRQIVASNPQPTASSRSTYYCQRLP